MDRLQKEVSALVEKMCTREDPALTFNRVWSLAAGRKPTTTRVGADRERAPRISEPWFC